MRASVLGHSPPGPWTHAKPPAISFSSFFPALFPGPFACCRWSSQAAARFMMLFIKSKGCRRKPFCFLIFALCSPTRCPKTPQKGEVSICNNPAWQTHVMIHRHLISHYGCLPEHEITESKISLTSQKTMNQDAKNTITHGRASLPVLQGWDSLLLRAFGAEGKIQIYTQFSLYF